MRNQGFTLIEFSIVLVITGLLIAGVLVGRDLISASETRRAVAAMEGFQSAVNTFKIKYRCIPGDCANAQELELGSNGNGTTFIGDWTVEPVYMMEHLNSAMLIQPDSQLRVLGVDMGFKGPDQSYITSTGNNLSVNLSPFGATGYMDFMIITRPDFAGEEFLPGLPSARAQAIDVKIDDGAPLSGNVRAIGTFNDEFNYAPGESGYPPEGVLGDNASCITDEVPAGYNNLTHTGALCSLAFKLYY